MKLLTLGAASPKLKKSDESKFGYLSAIMYLSPWKVSGYGNVCPSATVGCRQSCLNTSGRGRTNSVQEARQRRTKFFFENRTGFFSQLCEEISCFVKRCSKLGKKPAVRLNGTSDLQIEKLWPSIFVEFKNVQFYDYTKSYLRSKAFCQGKLAANYHLTFSRSEINSEKCREILDEGGNVAVVFRTKSFPKKYLGHKTFYGDDTDLRFLDPKPRVIALYAKGKAKHDSTGFVVE